MKFRLCLLALSFWFASGILQAAPSAPVLPVKDSIDVELNAIIALTHPTPPPGMTPSQHYQWFDGVCQKLGTEVFAFIEKYPTDPRRWRAALLLQQRRMQPRFVISIGDDYDKVGEKAVVVDAAAASAWGARVDQLEKELRAATDVPTDVGEQVDFGDMWGGLLMPSYQAAMEEKKTPDWAKIDAAFTAFLSKWPDFDATGLMSFYVSLKKAGGEKDELTVLKAFADSPNHSSQEYVKARERFFELSKHPIEMAFTAIDGRAVDLKKLRGKVVLIDFWATWCGPCIAEVPNVKEVFAKYHDKGFEIISISLDSEKDRQKFIELVAKEGVSWPQFFDGKGWKNKYAVEYTISGIPAMFLLDQSGMLVSTNARGEKLGSEVKRLLKL
jgi:thiol-disulfide isomerase/thioredoxin